MKQVDELQGEDGGLGPSPAAFRAPSGGHASDRPLRLPPNTSLEKFTDFMRSIEGIVGIDNATVVINDAELQHEDYMNPSKAHDVSSWHARMRCSSSSLDRCTTSPTRNTSSAAPW